MGVSCAYALCLDCQKNSCPKCGNNYYEYCFDVIIEWKTKKELIEYLLNLRCPCCGSDNWIMTDAYEH